MKLLPRIVRIRDAPSYLGMDRNRFCREVRPFLTEFPIGKQGIGFMIDRILIPCGNTWLALTREAYQEALQLGAELVLDKQAAESRAVPEWLTVEQLAAATNTSKSFWYEECRTGRCPSRRFGSAVRVPASFLTDVEA